MKALSYYGFSITLMACCISWGADWRDNKGNPDPTPIPATHRYCDNFEIFNSLSDDDSVVKPKSSASGAGYLGIPGMGDLLSLDYISVSFNGINGQTNAKIIFRHAFKIDNATKELVLTNIDDTRYFKYDKSAKFYLQADGRKYNFACSDYHIGTWGDDFVGYHAYETMIYNIPLSLLQSISNASTISGQLTPKATVDDDNYSRVFTFNHDFNDYITSFLFVLTGK